METDGMGVNVGHCPSCMTLSLICDAINSVYIVCIHIVSELRIFLAYMFVIYAIYFLVHACQNTMLFQVKVGFDNLGFNFQCKTSIFHILPVSQLHSGQVGLYAMYGLVLLGTIWLVQFETLAKFNLTLSYVLLLRLALPMEGI